MSRTYQIGEEKMVSVTTVIGDYDTGGLMQWAANEAVEYLRDYLSEIPCKYERWEEGDSYIQTEFLCGIDWDKARYAYKEISKEAQDIGTEVHDLAEIYIKAAINTDAFVFNVSERCRHAMAAFHLWIGGAAPKFLHSELTVHSDTHKYAGTLDCVCRLDGKLYIIDFKTSKAHYPKNAVQLAAYKMAYEEMTGLTVDGVAVLRLDKVTGEYDWKDYTKVVDRQFQTFLGLLQAWNCYKKRRL